MNDVEILHEKFARYGANAKEWMKKCVLLLPEINRQRIWEKKGFSSIYEYAAKLAGMSRYNVNESLRVLEKIADKPALKKIIEAKGLNAVKPIVTISSSETQEFWAEKAMQLTKNELEMYVRDFRGGKISNESLGLAEKDVENGLFQVGGLPRKSENCKKLLMELSPGTASRLEKFKGDDDWETLMKEFLALKEDMIEKDKPQPVDNTSRHIPAEIKKFVLKKYNLRCAFPGCNKSYDALHHTQRFFLENVHDPDTIVPLCFTHHSLAHKGFIDDENLSPHEWKIRERQRLGIADGMFLTHRK